MSNRIDTYVFGGQANIKRQMILSASFVCIEFHKDSSLAL